MTDELIFWWLHNATRQLPDCWRNMMSSVEKAATDGDQTLRNIVASDDETSPPHWVPYSAYDFFCLRC